MWGSQVALVVKNPPVNTGEVRDAGSIPGLGRSLGEGHGNPLQYSCLENPMASGAWWATVHRDTKSQTQLKQLSMHAEGIYKYVYVSIYIHLWIHFQGQYLSYQNLKKIFISMLFAHSQI